MERYGGSEGKPQLSDPSGPEMETGLNEAMWRLGVEGSKSYPERPSEADCIHYLRTGFCGYGAKCRFNHPPERGRVMEAVRTGIAEYPERTGQALCQHYMRTGSCKFGPSCKFNHPKMGAGSPVSLNCYGYPLRPGEKECSYYMKTGQCKFGASCKFHHPQPTDIPVSTSLPIQHPTAVPAPFLGPTLFSVHSPSSYSSQQYGVVLARPPLFPSYVSGPYGPVFVSPEMIQYPGWNPYQATVSSAASLSAQPTGGSSSLYGMAQLSPSVPAFLGPYQPPFSTLAASSGSQKEEYPLKPVQIECQHFMKTGDCKYGSSCRYHHPPNLSIQETSVILSPMGLPLRPGAPICAHFQQRGVCKFGQACRYDHPMRELTYSPSASSPSDMPATPHAVSYSPGTLAPSSSSSDLRPELISVATKVESASTRASPSMGTSTASVDTILSKDKTVPIPVKHGQNPSVISKIADDDQASN
ncbi:hypothetical protein SAY87_031447 [Trapa incisa]|uniref:C3H1-type domain-containing protein n=1 Tax=Trapa incisa TaxID=236973 RepID=A0AAN7QPM2_9MYRT|nr:hypothetical protein SAY87_031447 [Trapa incisa]